jgi:uncharacterized membrane protein
MFDLVNGLPVHPLVVHGVVVLLPLACFGTIAIVVRPTWRERYGVLVVACAAVATLLVPVATSSGEALKKRIGDPGAHADLGGTLLWFAIPVLVLTAALVWIDRPRRTGHHSGGLDAPRVVQAVAALALVAAVAASVQVYRVGDSGARAAWGARVASTG